MSHQLSFSNGHALITGGATGIGRAIAESFLAAGVPVVLAGRTAGALEQAVRVLGQGATMSVMDVSDRPTLKDQVQAIEANHGPINYLINNAGTNLKKPFVNVTDEEDDRILDTNLDGLLALSRYVARNMIERKQGNIVMMSSMAALVGLTGVVAYSASKTALLGITRSLAVELGPHGIRVNAICPGFIETEMFRKATQGDPERLAKITGRIASQDLGSPQDIAEACLYLCSNNAKYVSGVTLPVDGGFSIGF